MIQRKRFGVQEEEDSDRNKPWFETESKFRDVVDVLTHADADVPWRWYDPSHMFLPTSRVRLKWLNYVKIDWRLILKTQYVNHIQGSVRLSHKGRCMLQFWCHSPLEEDSAESYTRQSFYPMAWYMKYGVFQDYFAAHFLYGSSLSLLKCVAAGFCYIHTNLDKTIHHQTIRQAISGAIAVSLAVIGHSSKCSQDLCFLQVQEVDPQSIAALMVLSFTETTEKTRYKVDPILDVDTKEKVRDVLELAKERDPQFFLYGFNNVWIVKPAALSQGRGISCVQTLEDISRCVQQFDSNCVIQKYIENPLLVHKKKFDVRQWVLVTDVNPLTVYWWEEPYIRFASKDYCVDQWGDKFTHLCNNSIQKDSETSNPLASGNMWTCCQLKDELVATYGEDVWTKHIVPEMKRKVLITLQSTYDQLKKIGRGFEWLGYDIMIDEQLNVWVIEINISPDVSHSTPVTAAIVPKATSELLKVVFDSYTDAEPQDPVDVEQTKHGWTLLYRGETKPQSVLATIRLQQASQMAHLAVNSRQLPSFYDNLVETYRPFIPSQHNKKK